MMTYDEMKQKVSELNGINANELRNPRRFEAAGLGIIDMSQINYYGPIGLFCIYSGEWDSPDQKVIKNIVPSTNVDVFGEFYSILKDHIKKI